MIVKTLLDTDLYKFTTSYAYTKIFPTAVGRFTFKDRQNTAYTSAFVDELRSEIAELAHISLMQAELEYMTTHCRFIPRFYWEWLSSFRFDPSKVEVSLDADHHLHIEVVDLLYKATLYEVPILALVSELRNKHLGHQPNMDEVREKLYAKIALSNEHGLLFSEFGTRRRFSIAVQEEVVRILKEKATHCIGTSNCYLAMKYDLKMMGTHPHEWFMFHGAQFGYKHANYMALENWVNVYDGDLGIALSDTYTTGVFLSNLSRKQAKLFDGIRCDSGSELDFVDRLIARYREFGIDATTKTVVFSNALDFPKALEIQNYCQGRIRSCFGIGTNLTNDTGFKPANIVMKLTHCKMNANQAWRECIKLSDDKGKYTGSEAELASFLQEFGLDH